MLKKVFWISAVFISIVIISCGEQKIIGQKYDEPITVDGSFADWNNYGNSVIKSGDASYVIATALSDSQLYIMFRYNDARVARKMAMRGINLWISGKGKKDKEIAVKYQPHPMDFPGERSGGFNGMKNSKQSVKFQKVDFIIFKNSAEYLIGKSDTKNWDVASNFENSNYCFEYKIPLREIASEKMIQQNLKIGLEIPGLDKEEMENMRENMPDDMENGGMRGGPGGGGGRGAGRMHGGPGGGPGGSGHERMNFNSEEIWFKIVMN